MHSFAHAVDALGSSQRPVAAPALWSRWEGVQPETVHSVCIQLSDSGRLVAKRRRNDAVRVSLSRGPAPALQALAPSECVLILLAPLFAASSPLFNPLRNRRPPPPMSPLSPSLWTPTPRSRWPRCKPQAWQRSQTALRLAASPRHLISEDPLRINCPVPIPPPPTKRPPPPSSPHSQTSSRTAQRHPSVLSSLPRTKDAAHTPLHSPQT